MEFQNYNPYLPMPSESLDDLDPMPFGAHKGKPMQDVPPSYLHWFWIQPESGNPHGAAVRDYIKRNLSALKQEHRDGIW